MFLSRVLDCCPWVFDCLGLVVECGGGQKELVGHEAGEMVELESHDV